MICKLVVLAAVAAVASSQGAQYPAGVHPSLCPNYPNCDNALLALHAQGAAGAQVHAPVYAPAPAWNGAHAAIPPGWPGSPAGVNPAVPAGWPGSPAGVNPAVPAGWPGPPAGVPAVSAHAAQLPAGVSAHECPNYPYCTGHVGGHAASAPPLPGFAERQYPDGVSPHACPNYPYCH